MATYTHASNLAKFVVVYKAICSLIRGSVTKFRKYHTMIAAFFGGYIVFGLRNNVNEQVKYIATQFIYYYLP